MDNKTVGVIVRVYGPNGAGAPRAPIVATLSIPVLFHGYMIPATVYGETDEFGFAVLRLWPNVLGDVPSQYKIVITNPDSGKRKIVNAIIPAHDVFLDEISSANEGDWTDGGLGNPSGGGNNTALAGTITVGTTTTGASGTLALAINRGTPQARIVDFTIPAGRDGANGLNGLNGSGSISIKETITGAPGTPATVVNVGTGSVAELIVTIPQGIPGTGGAGTGTGGTGLPAGGTDGQLLVKVGSDPQAAIWKTFTAITDTLLGTYVWETGTTPPIDIGAAVMDSTTLTAYLNAIGNANIGSKRAAGANSIIFSMGAAQKVTLKRNGVQVLVADYIGAMVLTNDGTNIGATLNTLTTVSPIAVADVNTGTWTGELTGGAGYARKITLLIAPDVNTAPGQGYNPAFNLIVPRSLDGL